jgi:hypothetical protein
VHPAGLATVLQISLTALDAPRCEVDHICEGSCDRPARIRRNRSGRELCLFGFPAASYQPIDAIADRKNWKAGAGDWAWSTTVTAPLVVAPLVVAPLILGKHRPNENR